MSNINKHKSPFIGLKSFNNFDDYLPFKQESQVEDILEILQSNNLVTITGEAHSGKSSLINSGLIPRLKTGFPGQVGRNWSIVKFRPGVNPIENFCYSLSNTASLYLNSKPKTTDYIEYKKSILKDTKRGLVEIYRKSEIYKKNNLLIIIDNLDDLYSFPNYFDADESDDEDLLFNIIYNTLSVEKNGIYFVLTINNNNYRQLNVYDDFIKLLSQSQYQIPFFSSKKIGKIISSTFKNIQIKLPENFIEKISNVFFKNYSFLPNLQLFLNELYTGKIKLNENDFNIEKEMNNIFSKKLEEFHNLPKSPSKKIEKLFRALVKSDNKNIGLYYEKIDNLKTFLKLDLDEINELILNIENNIGEIFGSVRINNTGILKKHSNKYGSSDILYLKFSANLNWTRLNSWVENENEKFSRFNDYLRRAKFHPDKETIISEENIQSAVSFINNEINENWTLKYSYDLNKVKKYIYDNDNAISEKIRIRKEFEYRAIKKSQKLKRFGIVFSICLLFAGGYFVKIENDRLQKLDRLNLVKEDLEREKALLNKRNRIIRAKLIEDSLKITLQNEKMLITQSKIVKDSKRIALYRNKVLESQDLVSKARLENENSRLELSSKQELLLRNEKVISLIKNYTDNNKNISNLLFNIKHTLPSNLNNIKDISLNAINSFEIRNNILSKLDSIKAVPSTEKIDIIYDLDPDDNDLRQLSLNLIAKISGAENYSDVKEVDFIPRNNQPLNVLTTSNLGRLAVGGDSKILYRSNDPFNPQVSRDKTIYNEVRFDHKISNIEFIDEDVLAVGLSNGHLWYTNVVTKDKVQLYPDTKKRQRKIIDKISSTFNKNQIIDIKFIQNKKKSDIGRIYVLYSDKILIYNLSSKQVRLSVFDKLESNEFFTCSAYNKIENNFVMITNKNNLYSFFTKDDSYTVTEKKVFNFDDTRKPVKLDFYKNQILAATSDGWIYIYDYLKNIPSFNRRINVHETEISDIHSQISNNHIFSASKDGTFAITSKDDQTSIDIGKNNYITDFAYTKNMGERELLTSDKNGNLIYWEFDIDKAFDRIKSLYDSKY